MAEKVNMHLPDNLQLEHIHFSEEQLEQRTRGLYNHFFKRLIDFFVSMVLVIVLSPILLILSVCIIIEDGYPVFYTPLRGGYKDKAFHIYKFRTMVKNADQIGGSTTALNDSRITKVGAFLRKTKLDETAQLFNVLTGTMSFIGPRPELLQYTDAYSKLEKHILSVRPGMTDFSSIVLINLDEIVGNQNADEMYEKFVLKRKNELRLKYVSEISFMTDCGLFFNTIWRVIQKALRFIFGSRS